MKCSESGDSRKTPTPAPVTGSARLDGEWLTIRTGYCLKTYHLEIVVPGRHWRLRQANGAIFDVVAEPWGGACDCQDYIWRRESRDPRGCKHVQAIAAVGLLGEQS